MSTDAPELKTSTEYCIGPEMAIRALITGEKRTCLALIPTLMLGSLAGGYRWWRVITGNTWPGSVGALTHVGFCIPGQLSTWAISLVHYFWFTAQCGCATVSHVNLDE